MANKDEIMNKNDNDIELMDFLFVLWRRKWLIIIPAFFCVIVVAVISFFLPKKWEIDTIFLPSKFFTQTEQGTFEEIVAVDPKQIAGQINEESYNQFISAELDINIKEFPKLKAENLEETKLVRISIISEDVNKAKSILTFLFNHMKKDLDKKIDVEIMGINTKISTNENDINKKKLDIQSKKIEIAEIKQESSSDKNMLKISEERLNNVIDEMKAVKERIDEIEKQQRKALNTIKEEIEAISLLLYSNEIQQNLRYYDILNEKLSIEKITQENLRLSVKKKEQEIKQLNTQIEGLNNEIKDIENEIELLKLQKVHIDYAQLIKEPTTSLNPVLPRIRLNVLIAGTLSLIIFTMLAFFLDYLRKYRKN